MAVSVFINYILSKPKVGHTYIPLYPNLANYDFECKFTDIMTKFPSSLLLSIFEHLQSLSVNIQPTDFKLDVMFYCGFVVNSVAFPFLSTTDTAKHNLGRRGRPNLTNQLHHSSALSLGIWNQKLKKKRFWAAEILNFKIRERLTRGLNQPS
jgi:hypothetical protein